jgi:fibronectin-binding autotransporter adhesin
VIFSISPRFRTGMKHSCSTTLRAGQRPFLVAYIVVMVFWSAGRVRGQSSWTWSGSAANWNNNSSWSTGTNDCAGSSSRPQGYLNFTGSANTTANNDYSADSGAFQIYFNSGASAFTLTGNQLKFYDYGCAGNPTIENDSANLQTVNLTFGVGDTSGGSAININPNSGDMAFGAALGNAFAYFDDKGLPLTINGSSPHLVTFWGQINNGGASTKFVLASSAIVVFNAVNGYTGETDLNGGELRIGSGAGINASSAIYLGNGSALTTAAQLTLPATGGGQTFGNSFTVNPSSGGLYRVIAGYNTSGTNTYSGTITLNGDANLTATNAGGTLNFSGPIKTTTGKFINTTGLGTVLLTGSSDNTSIGLNAAAGTVVLAKSSSGSVHAIGNTLNVNSGGTAQLSGSGGDQIWDGAGVVVNSGGVFDLGGQSETVNYLTLNGNGLGNGALINSGAGAATLTPTNGVNLASTSSVGGTSDLTISGTVSNTTSQMVLTKVGANTLTLAGTFDNLNLALAVSNGTVVLGKTSSASVHADGGSVNIYSGGTVHLGGSGGDQIYNYASVTNNSGGVLDLNGQNETINNLSLAGSGMAGTGALINNNGSTTATLTTGGNGGVTTLAANATMGGSANLTLANAVGDGGGGFTLTKAGTGTLTISSANTYSGGTTVKAGTVVFSGASSTACSGPLGPSNSVVNLGDTAGTAGATLTHSGNAAVLYYPLTVQSGSSGTKTLADISATSVNYSSNIVLNDSVTLDPGSTGNIMLNGPVTGGGGINKVSAGNAQLNATSSANTFSGNITISQGTFQLGSATAIPNGSGKGTVMLNPTSPNLAILDLHGNNQTINGLASSGTGTAVVTNSLSSSKTLTVGTPGSSPSTTFAGAIQDNPSGTLGLTKAGSGTLTLSGANTYVGITTITAGTLALGASGSINNTPTNTIAAGATFDVSAITAYSLSGSTTLTASGTGTTVGTSAAAIKGASGGTVSLGSRPIVLTYDGSHPALYISQGTLSLNGNAFTVNSAAALAAGTYIIIQQASGNITSTGTYSVTGTAIGSGKTASISVTGGNVNLVIQNTTSLSLTSLGGNPSTYGTALTFQAAVSPDPGNGSTVTFLTNGVAFGTATTTSGTATLTTSTLTYSGGSAYTVTAGFTGNANYTGSTNTLTGGQQINKATPVLTAPSAGAITYGQTLSNSTLIGGAATNVNNNAAIVGNFAFATPTIAPAAGSTNVSVIFTPSDAVNYTTATTAVTVTVGKMMPSLTVLSSSPTNGYEAGVVFTATNLPADATSNLVFAANGTAFSTNGVVNGGATSLAITNLPRATTNIITAIYGGDSNYRSASTSLIQVVTNHPPVANAATYNRGASNAWRWLVSDFLTNATDLDGDALTLTVPAASTNGITVSVGGGVIMYYNPNVVADQFTYFVTDGYGGTNSATVSLTVSPSGTSGQVTGLTATNGVVAMNFAGIPAFTYDIQVSTNLNGPWNTLWTTNAPAAGLFQFIDSHPPAGSGFYRLQYQP